MLQGKKGKLRAKKEAELEQARKWLEQAQKRKQGAKHEGATLQAVAIKPDEETAPPTRRAQETDKRERGGDSTHETHSLAR